jgi:hypothetical protein
VGSIVTVGALSLIDSFSFGPRILGGVLGQLLCLAAILGFRWGREAAMKGGMQPGNVLIYPEIDPEILGT